MVHISSSANFKVLQVRSTVGNVGDTTIPLKRHQRPCMGLVEGIEQD